mmetsp:Transcript_4715/g.8053  ORF Transcript_4715/g.8053 Transcript_4715/m.8053 type:complete len:175 (-) Transcript_4715:1041-1565(-)
MNQNQSLENLPSKSAARSHKRNFTSNMQAGANNNSKSHTNLRFHGYGARQDNLENQNFDPSYRSGMGFQTQSMFINPYVMQQKQEEKKKRWVEVLRHKEENLQLRQKKMKDLVLKQQKLEREMLKRERENHEKRKYLLDQQNQRLSVVINRKKQQEVELSQRLEHMDERVRERI